MTAHGITMAVRLISEDISFRRNAAAEYGRMGLDDMEKAFEKGRAATAEQDARELQEVVTHLMGKLETKTDEKQTA